MKQTNKKSLLSIIVILAASAFYACSPASPKLKPEATVTYEKVNTTNNNVFRRPAVDILFVVDESGSMSDHQANLIKNVDLFVNEFSKLKLIDYHIGVISTSIGDNGALRGKPSYIEANTPGGLNALRSNLKLGINGDSWEMVFDPVAAALSPAMTNTKNAGFYRQQAHLVLIFITDAEDQSRTYTSNSLFNYLVNLKGGDKRKVLAYGAIVASSLGSFPSCPRDEGMPKKIESFLSLVATPGKNNIVSLCDSDYGLQLVEFSKEIVQAVNKPIVLDKAPIVGTIRVFFGAQEIQPNVNTGWTYDPKTNAIIFGESLVLDENQPPDAKLEVYFDSAKFPEQPN